MSHYDSSINPHDFILPISSSTMSLPFFLTRCYFLNTYILYSLNMLDDVAICYIYLTATAVLVTLFFCSIFIIFVISVLLI